MLAFTRLFVSARSVVFDGDLLVFFFLLMFGAAYVVLHSVKITCCLTSAMLGMSWPIVEELGDPRTTPRDAPRLMGPCGAGD